MEQWEQAIKGRRVVLLGGGEIRDYKAVSARIHPDDFILCVDSGYDHCWRLDITPDLIVGDFDSVRGTPPDTVPSVPFPREKDYTDTTHALEIALDHGCNTMLLAGMLGGRLDHTVGNLQNLANLSRKGVNAYVTDGYTDGYCLTDGSQVLANRKRHYFSVFTLSQTSTGVNISGAKYALTDYTLTFDMPRGVGNEFLDGDATISVEQGTLLILCEPMDL